MQNLAPINQDKDFVTKAYVDGLFAGSGGGGGTAEPSDLTEKVTALENDVKTLLGYFTGTKATNADKLDGYDSSAFALAASLGALATKDNIAFSELTSKPTTLTGYGITDALGKSETAASATKLADSSDFNIWGQTFFTGGKPKSVTGLATFGDGIVIGAGKAIKFLDSAGASHALTYDSSKKAFKIDGDFYATGENSAGGMGEELGSMDDFIARLAAVETNVQAIPSQIEKLTDRVSELEEGGGSSAINNVEIMVSSLAAYDGKTNMTSAGMAIFGLSVAVANKMLEGAYNKVIDKTDPSYPSVWNYSAYSTSTQIVIMIEQGDGFDIMEGYSLKFTRSTLQWSISRGEI